MAKEARGTFEVKLTPVQSAGDPISGMTIEKTFQGDMQGTSAGQMLAFRSAVAGSAGYVALERIVAELDGRQGSFTLQHSGTMERGSPSLMVKVVPDSATGGLVGLVGEMDIVAGPDRHDYSFRYTLPD